MELRKQIRYTGWRMKTAQDLRIPFTWQERRPIYLDRMLYVPSSYEQHEEWPVLPWSAPELFGNENPVHIEYCSGNGQWIGEKAKQNPHINWVAVDKLFERARKIWLKIHREEIPNLYVVFGEATTFTRYYVPKESVEQIYVNFPDPWPKLRHAKHRLVQLEFLQEIQKIVCKRGKATFVTDDWPYAQQMLVELAKCSSWTPLIQETFYTTDWPDYGGSFFKDLWLSKGRTIYYLPFERA